MPRPPTAVAAPVGRSAWWRAAAEDDRRTWGIGERALVGALVVPPAAAVLLGATVVHRALYRWLTAEDGLLEWSQLALDVAGVVGAAVVVTVLHRRGHRGMAALWAVFALGMFLIAGEEVSWGQRVMGTGTPEALARVNHQDETNVHNIGPVQDAVNVVFLAAGAYGSMGVVALRRATRDRPRPWWFDLLVPPHALVTLFGLVFAFKVVRLAVLPSPRFVVVKYGEVIELCIAAGLAGFAWLSARRLLRVAPPSADPQTG